MPNVDFVVQHMDGMNHTKALKDLFSLREPTYGMIMTAFMTSGGLERLEKPLRRIAPVTDMFVGIRNSATTAQALLRAMEYGFEPWVVDTGNRMRIFHNKCYYVENARQARLLMGSANLTINGMEQSLEVSQRTEFDLSVDPSLFDKLDAKADWLIAQGEPNVTQIKDPWQIDELLEVGLVMDEGVRKLSMAGRGSERTRRKDNVPAMKFKTPKPPVVKPLTKADVMDAVHMWRSRPLSRNKLSIPEKAGSNETGGMVLTKGLFTEIDQRHYFRDAVFDDLDWSVSGTQGKEHLERAWADVRVVIKGQDYGVHRMMLTHNTKTDSVAYRQNNGMTHLYWGDALGLVAQEDLIDRQLDLYKKPDEYVVEIA